MVEWGRRDRFSVAALFIIRINAFNLKYSSILHKKLEVRYLS